jgi:sulfoquinovosidase
MFRSTRPAARLCIALTSMLILAASCRSSPDDAGPVTDASGEDSWTDDSGGSRDAAPDVLTSAECLEDGQWHTHGLGSWVVHWESGTGAWRVARGTQEVMASLGPCGGDVVRLHEVAPQVRNLFGAFRIDLAPGAAREDWDVIETPPDRVEVSEEQVAMVWELRSRGATVQQVFSLYGERDLAVSLQSSKATHVTGEMGWRCGADESFFGLGTQVVGMDLRGRTYPLWTQEQGNGKPEGGGGFPLNNVPEAAYAPMGVLFSSAGYAGLVGHDGYHELDLCHQNPEALRLRSYPLLPSMVFVSGETPKEQVEAVTEYVGRVSEPPDWVFGPWNDAVGGPERMWDVANTLRENDIPSSAMWVEDWIGGSLTATGFRLSYRWSWDEGTYPDLPQDIASLQARGFAFLAYFNPFIPTTVPTYQEGLEQGFLIKRANGEVYTFQDPAFRVASMVDLSNPGAEAWLKGYLRTAARELRIDGWMADFAEWLPVDTALSSGEDAWLFHNRYPMEWQRIHREVFEEVLPRSPGESANNWTFFARSGWASVHGGTAGLAPTLWGGDQNTDWKYDDGLPTIIPMAAHVGLAGVAIFGSDIAGYSSLSSPNTDTELFLRWSSVGAFHPLMRTHHGSDKCNNWMFDRDEETLAHYRRYAKIHTMLLPFWRGLADEAVAQGLPIIRHPYLVEPQTPRLWAGRGYQFFLGDDVLVAPVIDQGQTTRQVVLADGACWPLFGDAAVEGPELVVEAAVTEIPVFVRSGTILPLLMEPVDSLYLASVEGVTDQRSVAGAYRLALYPDTDGALRETTVGQARVSGQGWTSSSFADQATSVNGEALPACGMESEGRSCREEDGVRLVGARLVLTSGSGRLEIEGTETQTYRIGFGGAIWRPYDAPTSVTDLNPQTSSYCDL